jgi:outer membrane protein assembly factor BamB
MSPVRLGFSDHVEALEAASRDLLWGYSRQLPKEVLPSVKRNLALYGDRLFIPTSDSHMLLDIKTGKMIWDRAIGDYSTCFHITGGPLAAKVKVIEGVEGPAPGGNTRHSTLPVALSRARNRRSIGPSKATPTASGQRPGSDRQALALNPDYASKPSTW